MTLTITTIGIIIIILLVASLCAFVHFTGRSDQARTHLKTKADQELYKALINQGLNHQEAMQRLSTIDPFNRYPEHKERRIP